MVVTVFVIAGAFLLNGGGMFNPGALSAKTGAPLGGVRSHAGLSRQCAACHPAPWSGQTMTDRCLACHTNLQAELKAPKTLHGVIAAQGAAITCRACHTDHRGAQAQITFANLDIFPHDGVGFSLNTHQAMYDGSPFTCQGCHTQSLTSLDVTACVTCHSQHDPAYMQNHLATFGGDCLNCHDGKETLGKSFDHARVAFVLQGKHTQLDCSACHQGNTTLAALRAVPQSCAGCHQSNDPHQGALGSDCARCHTAESWRAVSFDHSTVSFQLDGAHAQVACAGCHSDLLFKSTPVDCFSCHGRQDPHAGALGTGCQECHTPVAWQDIAFDHNLSNFPLTGAHILADCKACHTDMRFKGAPTQCVSCHTKDDAHDGSEGTDCLACHTTQNWTQTTFNHNSTAFQLTGAHASAACASCHTGMHFKNAPTQCAGCHAKDDPHAGTLGECSACHDATTWGRSTFNHSQAPFKLVGGHVSVQCSACHASLRYKDAPTACVSCHQKDDAHQGSLGSDCGQCHSAAGWKPSTFNHNNAAFKLTGAHASVACASCHPNAQFNSAPTQCGACHAKNDAHSGQFGTDCGSCHSTSAWKPATFDHARSGFPLTGAHASVACASCHPNGQFKGTPTACASCHSAPSNHSGFGTDCAACHSTSAWQPASFNGPHPFPMNHGGAGSCQTCHPSSFASYTCYGCHNQAEVQNKHARMGDFSNCMQCHPNGGKPEGD